MNQASNDNWEEPEMEGQTMCKVIVLQTVKSYIFTKLKIDITPNICFDLPYFQQNRMIQEPLIDEFYVFKRNQYSFQKGQQINLFLDDFDFLRLNGRYTIYYNRNEFSKNDISELKTVEII